MGINISRVQRKSVLQLVIWASCMHQPKGHFNQPQILFDEVTAMITQFLYCNFNPSKNVTVLYIGQVKNEIHQCNSKIHQSRAIGHHLLFAIILCCLVVPQHVHGQLTYTSELSPLTHKTNTCTCFKEDNQTKFRPWSANRNNFYDCIFCRHKACFET